MKLDEFLQKIEQECTAAGVAVVFSPGNRVFYDGMACNGFFESRFPLDLLPTVTTCVNECGPGDLERVGPVLAAAQGGKNPEEFLSLLAHEYCHMRQFIEGSALWIELPEFKVWEEWLAGADVDAAAVHDLWRRIVMLEADCETRVLAMAQDLQLELDSALYARRANSYLFFYSWALKNRRFYNTAPYEIEDLVQQMPAKMLPLQTYVDSELATSLIPLFDRCA